MDDTVNCQQCGNAMHRTTHSEHNVAMQLLAVVVFIVGLALLFVVPIGTIIGIFLMLASLRMGYKQRKVWACDHCGYFFDRM